MIIVAHLARALPRKLLLDMMLTGRPIDADEAYRAGFVGAGLRRHRRRWTPRPTSTPAGSPTTSP